MGGAQRWVELQVGGALEVGSIGFGEALGGWSTGVGGVPGWQGLWWAHSRPKGGGGLLVGWQPLPYSGPHPRLSQPQCSEGRGSGGRRQSGFSRHLCPRCPQALFFIHFCAFSPSELTKGGPDVQNPNSPTGQLHSCG